MAQNEMADVVYKRCDRQDIGNSARQNMRVFNILVAIDGKRSVGTIAKEDHYEMEDLIGDIRQLQQQGLIEPIVSEESSEDRTAFFQKLEAGLNHIMGPVSGIIIQESVTKSGHNPSNFPLAKAYELIDLVAESIPDNAAAKNFQRTMADALNTSA